MGWVVSAAAKRYGGWKLWGVWTDGPIPALALPLCWPELADAQRLPALLRRLNDDTEALQRPELLPELRLDDDLRTTLKIELTRLYRMPYPDVRPMEVGVDPSMLDLLPWIYLLGPVEPGVAQLQPSRFNGAGYQYILSSSPAADGRVLDAIDKMVDTAADDVLQGFRLAGALRERRARPRTSKSKPRPSENLEMRNTPSPPKAAPPPSRPAPIETTLRAVRDVILIALLAWIGFEVHQLRRAMTAPSPAPIIESQPTVSEPEPEPVAPTLTREERLANELVANPPQGIRVEAAATKALPHAAVEIFLRRNGCFARSEPVDGRFSAAEQKAIRTCTALTTARLMRSGIEPHSERALDWLEKALAR